MQLKGYKTIKDFRQYMINLEGVVINTKDSRIRVLNPYSNKTGYVQVTLCKDGYCYKKGVNKLVEQTFGKKAVDAQKKH